MTYRKSLISCLCITELAGSAFGDLLLPQEMERALEVWRQLVTGLGMQLTIEGMIAEGDVVAVRYTESGTFTGPFMGHEPTGKSYEVTAMEWFIIRNGKIQQRWGARDQASQARQIGIPLK